MLSLLFSGPRTRAQSPCPRVFSIIVAGIWDTVWHSYSPCPVIQGGESSCAPLYEVSEIEMCKVWKWERERWFLNCWAIRTSEAISLGSRIESSFGRRSHMSNNGLTKRALKENADGIGLQSVAFPVPILFDDCVPSARRRVIITQQHSSQWKRKKTYSFLLKNTRRRTRNPRASNDMIPTFMVYKSDIKQRKSTFHLKHLLSYLQPLSFPLSQDWWI